MFNEERWAISLEDVKVALQLGDISNPKSESGLWARKRRALGNRGCPLPRRGAGTGLCGGTVG